MYAAKMNRAGLIGDKTKPKRTLDPTMDTFLGLNDSPDPCSSDSSQPTEEPDKVGRSHYFGKGKNTVECEDYPSLTHRHAEPSPHTLVPNTLQRFVCHTKQGFMNLILGLLLTSIGEK